MNVYYKGKRRPKEYWMARVNDQSGGYHRDNDTQKCVDNTTIGANQSNILIFREQDYGDAYSIDLCKCFGYNILL